MAAQINWADILSQRFPTFRVEETAYLSCLEIASSMEVYIEKIYEAVRHQDHVPENLKLMYHEASINGNKEVVRRIQNRISHIRRNCK